jgi:hypothetical protein
MPAPTRQAPMPTPPQKPKLGVSMLKKTPNNDDKMLAKALELSMKGFGNQEKCLEALKITNGNAD